MLLLVQKYTYIQVGSMKQNQFVKNVKFKMEQNVSSIGVIQN